MNPVTRWRLLGYRLAYQTNLDPEMGRGGLTAMIHLMGEDGRVGCVEFMPDGQPLPQASRAGVEEVRMALPHSEFTTLLGLLRNEQNLWLHWSQSERRAWIGSAHADMGPDTS